MTALFRTTRTEATSLPVVLAEVADLLGPGTIGFLSAPTEHHLVRFVEGVPVSPGGPVALAGVFAARLFHPDAELRWRHRAGGTGRAVIVAERAGPLPGWSPEPVEVIDTIDGRYAVWGRRFGSPDGDAAGWCRAFEGRLGWLDVPMRGPVPDAGDSSAEWPQQYLCLTYREYVAEDAYGNAEVIEERLLAIETTSPTRGEVPA